MKTSGEPGGKPDLRLGPLCLPQAESELVLWHEDSMYTSALLYVDSRLSEKLKHVQTLNVYLLRAQSGKLESAQQAANLYFEALERKKSSLSRLWSLCVMPFVVTDG